MNTSGNVRRYVLIVLILSLVAVVLYRVVPVHNREMTAAPPAPVPSQPPPPVKPVQVPQMAPPRPKAAAPVIVNKKAPPVVAPLPTAVVPAVPEAPPPEPREWIGTDSAVTHSGQIVIHNDHQWVQFWSEHRPHEPAPELDFSKDMVVGVFAGPRPAEQFAIHIFDIHPQSSGATVDYQEQLPPPGTFAANVTVYPYDIKVIPKIAGAIKFNQLAVVDPRRDPHHK